VEGTVREVKRRVRVVASSYRAIDRSVTRWIVVTMVEWSSEAQRIPYAPRPGGTGSPKYKTMCPQVFSQNETSIRAAVFARRRRVTD